jgi:hypothetical protein
LSAKQGDIEKIKKVSIKIDKHFLIMLPPTLIGSGLI